MGSVTQKTLVTLHGLQLGQLSETCHQRMQMLLLGRSRSAGEGTFDLCEPGDHASIDAIGFLQPPHAFGKAAHRARVENGYRQIQSPELAEGLFFISTGSLHGHQFDAVLVAEVSQLSDAFYDIRETALRPIATDPGLQRSRGNIDSTNDLGHGNLPCTCD